MADLILPAAGWGEKDGTFINSERRIGLIKKVAKAPGEAMSDFNIFKLVAHYWGCGEMFTNWDSPEAVFQILKRSSAGQPCDITGIEDYRIIDERGGIQWPFPDCGLPLGGERRLFEDGRAKFCFEQPKPLPEPPNARYQFNLLTGRGTASQWHTQTRTQKSAVLRKLYPEQPFAEVNPSDAKQLGISQNAWITVASQRSRFRVRAFLTNAVQPGHVFIPLHYDGVNHLTDPVFDPYSKQPSYKACAVTILK